MSTPSLDSARQGSCPCLQSSLNVCRHLMLPHRPQGASIPAAVNCHLKQSHLLGLAEARPLVAEGVGALLEHALRAGQLVPLQAAGHAVRVILRYSADAVMVADACSRYGSSTGLWPCMQGPAIDCKLATVPAAAHTILL